MTRYATYLEVNLSLSLSRKASDEGFQGNETEGRSWWEEGRGLHRQVQHQHVAFFQVRGTCLVGLLATRW